MSDWEDVGVGHSCVNETPLPQDELALHAPHRSFVCQVPA